MADDDDEDDVSWEDRRAVDDLTRPADRKFTDADRREQKEAMRPLWEAIQRLFRKTRDGA